MKVYNICTKKVYEKDGEKKTIWLKCGSLTVNDKRNMFIQLNQQPDTSFYVFEPKPREERSNGPEDVDWNP